MADKYEPYEKPSAVPGTLAIGAGIGALAYLARKKIPGFKVLEKIAKTKHHRLLQHESRHKLLIR